MHGNNKLRQMFGEKSHIKQKNKFNKIFLKVFYSQFNVIFFLLFRFCFIMCVFYIICVLYTLSN